MRAIVGAIFLGIAVWPVSLPAQQSQTLADIRQELSMLYVEVQRLKRELSTTGAPMGVVPAGSPLERIDAIEAELQRLTGKTEELEHRIGRVVRDGTNRIGDLEFRLVELEGGDVSQLGETTTLGGGGAPVAPPTPPAQTGGTELAVGEEADFRRASEALASGDHATAAALFDSFSQTYPGGPLESEAHLRRGQALDAMGETTTAARAFLESYSGQPSGPVAPEALFHLGASLGKLGQMTEACVTLAEVEVRFPGNPFVARARAEMGALNCS